MQNRIFKFEARIPESFKDSFLSGDFQRIILQSLLRLTEKEGCLILAIEMHWLELALFFEAKNFNENFLIAELEGVLKEKFAWEKDLFEHPLSCERCHLAPESNRVAHFQELKKPDLSLGFRFENA